MGLSGTGKGLARFQNMAAMEAYAADAYGASEAECRQPMRLPDNVQSLRTDAPRLRSFLPRRPECGAVAIANPVHCQLPYRNRRASSSFTQCSLFFSQSMEAPHAYVRLDLLRHHDPASGSPSMGSL